jgi:hypothetical protein
MIVLSEKMGNPLLFSILRYKQEAFFTPLDKSVNWAHNSSRLGIGFAGPSRVFSSFKERVMFLGYTAFSLLDQEDTRGMGRQLL